MRNTLQYIYSISILFGVLVTAYFMMDAGIPVITRSLAVPDYRVEANSADPAVNQLFQFERELGKLPRVKPYKNLNTPKDLVRPK